MKSTRLSKALLNSAYYSHQVRLRSPKFITKYTDKRGFNAIIRGSIRIGSLSQYRHQESALSADSDEGVMEVDFATPQGNFAGDIGSFESVLISGAEIIMTEGNLFDRWVFCATLGEHSAAHHNLILNGNDHYCGNSSYLYYVEFDADLLFNAVVEAAILKQPSMIADATAHNVKYSSFLPRYSPEKKLSADDWAEFFHMKVFYKEPYFAPEREYRILFQPAFFEQYPSECAPFTVRSKAIKRSISKYGKIKNPKAPDR